MFQGNTVVTEIIPRYSTGAIYLRAVNKSAYSKPAVLVSQNEKKFFQEIECEWNE